MDTQRELKQEGKLLARVTVGGFGETAIETGISVLDHLLGLLARYGRFDLTLQLASAPPTEQVTVAACALGETLNGLLRADGACGHGTAMLPSDEALAAASLDISNEPRLHSNVDLARVHVGGLEQDLAATFLSELARTAGVDLHVRLLEGQDEQHVLEAIFKALGWALGQATRTRRTT
jgi:imidazoleglycerol-phosphate dehydratase